MQRSRIYVKTAYTATACAGIILAAFIFPVICDTNKLTAGILTLQFLNSENYQIPRNITIGIRYFCTSYTNYTYCEPLPFQVSVLLRSLQYPSSGLNALDKALAKLHYKTIAGCLIIGLVLAVLLWFALAFFLSILNISYGQLLVYSIREYRANRQLWINWRKIIPIILYISHCAILCTVCSFPYFILGSINSTSHLNNSDIRIKQGDTFVFCLGAFYSSLCMAVFAFLTILFN